MKLHYIDQCVMSSKKRLHTTLNTVYLIEEHVYLARGLEEFFPHNKWTVNSVEHQV